MILFESPSRKAITLPTSTNSYEFRHKLIRSLQPLKQKYPSIIIPDSPPTFSLGLQPYLDHQHYHHVTLAAASTAHLNPNWMYAASFAPYSASFFKFLITFVSGGLFFSTAIAAIASCYVVGVDNVKRFADVLFVIIQRVWITFTLGLGATKLAFLGEEDDDSEDARNKLRWKSAWTVLKEKLQETKETAARGVEALRQEAKIYSAAVGTPGLIPLQHMLDRMMPLSLANILEDSIKESLASMPKQKTIKKMTLSNFNVGDATPVLEAARVYDVQDAIAFDYDVKWKSQVEATVQVHTALARVPIVLKNFEFDGVVRVILTPLIKEAPGYGAMLLSLPDTPKISLDVRVLGGEVPFLKQEITSALYKSMQDEWLWPRRNIVPSMKDGGNTPILPQKVLANLRLTDPLLQAEEALRSEQPLLIKEVRDNPSMIDEKEKQKILNISVDNRGRSTSQESKGKEKTKGSITNQTAGLDSTIHFPDEIDIEIEDTNWWQPILQSFHSLKSNHKKKEDGVIISNTPTTDIMAKAFSEEEDGKFGEEKNKNGLQFGWFQKVFQHN
jgi:hypothetical protein